MPPAKSRAFSTTRDRRVERVRRLKDPHFAGRVGATVAAAVHESAFVVPTFRSATRTYVTSLPCNRRRTVRRQHAERDDVAAGSERGDVLVGQALARIDLRRQIIE